MGTTESLRGWRRSSSDRDSSRRREISPVACSPVRPPGRPPPQLQVSNLRLRREPARGPAWEAPPGFACSVRGLPRSASLGFRHFPGSTSLGPDVDGAAGCQAPCTSKHPRATSQAEPSPNASNSSLRRRACGRCGQPGPSALGTQGALAAGLSKPLWALWTALRRRSPRARTCMAVRIVHRGASVHRPRPGSGARPTRRCHLDCIGMNRPLIIHLLTYALS